jgi:hypothetical protein
MINRPPKGGLAAPLSGGIATYCPCPSGAGEEAEGRAGWGLDPHFILTLSVLTMKCEHF